MKKNLLLLLTLMLIPSVSKGENITFADEYVMATCVANWDTNGDGLLSKEEAAAVTDIENVFRHDSFISSFNELRYFTGLTSIGREAFELCEGLTSITIPESVEIIEERAFASCGSLASITILGCVSIGDYAFEDCNLRTIVIPEGVTSIGEGAFSSCSHLASITIPNSLTTIGECAFVECTSLTSIIIPEGVTSIGDGAFAGCSHLASVTFPSTVTNIGSGIIAGCSDNLSLVINISTIEDWFRDMNNLKEVVLGNNVKTIGEDAFNWCTGLTSVEISSSVTSIGNRAFSGCASLNSIDIPENLKNIGERAFEGCSGINHISIPSSVTSIGDYAFSGCSSLTSLIISEGVPSIGECAFYECNSLISISIPSSVTSISVCAFQDCTALTSIEFSEGIMNIDNGAFFGCSRLTSIAIPSSVTSIGEGAFGGCNSLISVTVEWKEPLELAYEIFSNISNATLYVPAGRKNAYKSAYYWKDFKEIIEMESPFPNISFTDENVKSLCVANWDTNGDGGLTEEELAAVTDLGNVFSFNETITSFKELQYFTGLTNISSDAFSGCSSLISITIPSSVTIINSGAFESCSALASINIPEGVTSIGDYAFGECSSLTSITIPEGVTSINYCAFYNCSGLTSINIPEGVTSIGFHAFYGCSSLTSIEIPSSVTAIGEEAFMECTSLTFIKIPSSVTSIGDGVFFGCDNLTSVTIPRGVTSIGESAFSECGNLTSVIVEWTEPIAITSGVFSNRANATLYVPAGSKAAYEAADYWKEFKEIIEVAVPEPQTDNVLSATSTTILKDQEVPLSLSLTNEDEIIMTEFYMQLPDGITIEEDEDGYPIVTINSGRENKHVIEVSRNSEGLYHFLCYSSKNNAFKGNEGELFSMNLICAEGVTAGTYTATVKDIIMSDVDRNELTQSDFTFDITVLDVAMGDANGDGRINGMDIVEMVDYIMERPSNSFVFAAADLTGDGKVNGMDLVELVSLVMAQGATQAAPPSALPRREGTLQTEKLDMGTLALKRNEDGGVMLGVEDPDEFILAQMVVEVSDGTLTDVTTDNAHVATWSPIGENRYSVLAYSMRNRLFTTNDCLLTFLGCEGNVTVKDVMLVDADREARFFADVTYNGTTGIVPTPNPSLKRRESIYDLSGRKLETRNMKLGTSPKGVYIVNGKKVVVK